MPTQAITGALRCGPTLACSDTPYSKLSWQPQRRGVFISTYSLEVRPSYPAKHRHLFLALRAFLGPFFVACFTVWAMLKCSSFLPALSAAASQSGFSPRPAQVSTGFSRLRYLGATGPRAPDFPPLEIDSRDSLSSLVCRVCRSSAILLRRIVSSCSLSFVSLSMDIDFRFISDLQSESRPPNDGCTYQNFVKQY